MPHIKAPFPEAFAMALDEQQQTLLNNRTRSQLSVTIVEAGPTPQISPISDKSTQHLLSGPLETEVHSFEYEHQNVEKRNESCYQQPVFEKKFYLRQTYTVTWWRHEDTRLLYIPQLDAGTRSFSWVHLEHPLKMNIAKGTRPHLSFWLYLKKAKMLYWSIDGTVQ
ncbi:uncharacterized protein LOC108735058 isoform X1 [Agrilus planipennis]|uniref:Uncharacterized protein LOC108735058 isoform X1 n=1 Tax=Agrilus planipennis TaxID=224129 RepID=A0A1W4WPF7_AGRPL|nr:uncharacterized protein LOC108735058 isoform X1 [Agrilus planipennis]